MSRSIAGFLVAPDRRGGALATASDLARFGHSLASGRGELLAPAWARQMTCWQLAARSGGQGLGWLLDHGGIPHYGGGTVGHSAYLAPAACVGRYVRRSSAHEISSDGDGLVAEQHDFGPITDLLSALPPFRLHPLGGGCYATDQGLRWGFSDPDPDGRPTRLLTLHSHNRGT